MRRTLSALIAGLIGLHVSLTPTAAAGSPTRERASRWAERDTAVYVVSTLNLCRSSHGHPLSKTLNAKLDVSRYNVYADLEVDELYFIELKRDNGTVVAAMAYQMGWSKPRAITSASYKFGLRKVPQSLLNAYKSDAKRLIGSFSSTLPSYS